MAIPSHLEKPKYRVRCLCQRCGNEFSYVTTKITDRDRACPRKACKTQAAAEEHARMVANITKMIEDGRGPAQIGNNNSVKAQDLAHKIVMEDQGFTDLKDNTREGDTSTPRIAPHLQKQVDGFWGGGKAIRKSNPALANQMNVIGRAAVAGSFRPQGPTVIDAIASADTGPKLKPAIRVIAGDRG